jgi:hypothetical protein
MEKSEVVELILFVKGIWQEQASDDLTIAAWIEVLAETSLSLRAIKAAVIQRARAGLDRPTPGQIYQEAAMIEHEAAERARYSRKAIEYLPSEEERAGIKAGFRDLIAKLVGKMGI